MQKKTIIFGGEGETDDAVAAGGVGKNLRFFGNFSMLNVANDQKFEWVPVNSIHPEGSESASGGDANASEVLKQATQRLSVRGKKTSARMSLVARSLSSAANSATGSGSATQGDLSQLGSRTGSRRSSGNVDCAPIPMSNTAMCHLEGNKFLMFGGRGETYPKGP